MPVIDPDAYRKAALKISKKWVKFEAMTQSEFRRTCHEMGVRPTTAKRLHEAFVYASDNMMPELIQSVADKRMSLTRIQEVVMFRVSRRKVLASLEDEDPDEALKWIVRDIEPDPRRVMRMKRHERDEYLAELFRRKPPS